MKNEKKIYRVTESMQLKSSLLILDFPIRLYSSTDAAVQF